MKKIKNLAIIILMTTFLIILGTKVEASTGTINSETVRIRKEPNTKSTILDQLDKGDEVEILEQEGDWYKVKAQTEQGKITGYISAKLLDVEETNQGTQTEQITEEPVEPVEVPEETPVENNQTILTENTVEEPVVEVTSDVEENTQYTLEKEVSIKALPLMNSIEKAKINGNVEIVEIINDWCRIESDTESGWIRINILKQSLPQVENPIQEQPTEKMPEEIIDAEPELPVTTEPEETTTTINKTGYVNAEGLKVRKEPNTSSEELDSLKRNDTVEIVGQTGNWYKINLNGEIGYVSAKYISDTKLPETTSRSGSSLKTEQETTTEQNQETATTEPEETQKVEDTPTASTSTTTGAAVVEYAKQYLGYKYVSGGTSPSTGFDCSGFTSYVYKHFGVSLNRSSKAQIKNGVEVEKSDLQLGDIVLFNNDANTAIGHVGIYVGDGNFIHASNPQDGVKITTLSTGYYQKRYVGARRVI